VDDSIAFFSVAVILGFALTLAAAVFLLAAAMASRTNF
jgi:hypothetical protein